MGKVVTLSQRMYYKRHELLKKEQDKLENGGSASGTEQDLLTTDETDYD